jgi:hypothetical protein
MSVLSCAALRQRVAAALSASAGWRQSPFAYEQHGLHVDSFADQTFAVGIVDTVSTPVQRQRRGAGLRVRSAVAVVYTRRNRPKDQIACMDEALAADDVLRRVVLGVSRADLHLTFDRHDRALAAGGEWRLHTALFSALHRIDLE